MNILSEALELECNRCHGKGEFADSAEPDGALACITCNGSGFVPTEIGARILSLMGHNSRLTVSAELHVSGAGS